MSAAAGKIPENALALPEKARMELSEALTASLGKSPSDVDDAWRTEVLRRVEQVRNGEVVLESWEDVRRAGREALPRG